ncbi:MAG: hydroxymethylglutaryl-CoA lyase [Blastococcus sp.]|jgi:hydroxymethylglutaryl-CoA lyase|nr:hydroxymethylglutaryl-CoA lyase [Blastococcus sp.]
MTLPASVTITDVALRDGLQIQPRTVPTDTKLVLLDALLAAGVRSLEAGSFVHPTKVPQMADADQLFRALPQAPGVEMMALVPNLRGARRAVEAGVRHIRIVLSCSEGHSRANTNRSVAEGIEETRQVVELLRSTGDVHITGALATVFVCPFDGIVPVEQVAHVVGALVDMGLDEISLSDTLGRANPDHVRRVVAVMRKAYPEVAFGLHLHNTFGMGMANVMAGVGEGVVQFDAALGGIGGCPFAPGAAGNIATEDTVFMLEGMGIATGIDLERLESAAKELQKALHAPLESAVSKALGWVA